jgi:hypothetical protein
LAAGLVNSCPRAGRSALSSFSLGSHGASTMASATGGGTRRESSSRWRRSGSGAADERLSSRIDPCLGANLFAGHRLDRFRPHERQRRQDRPCHRCGCPQSTRRDPAPRHLLRVPVGPSPHGGASERHARSAGGDLDHAPTLHAHTIRLTGLIDVGTRTRSVDGTHRHSLDRASEPGPRFRCARVRRSRSAGSGPDAAAAMAAAMAGSFGH